MRKIISFDRPIAAGEGHAMSGGRSTTLNCRNQADYNKDPRSAPNQGSCGPLSQSGSSSAASLSRVAPIDMPSAVTCRLRTQHKPPMPLNVG